MIAWNEQTLRAAASWKAFKEGAAMFGGGMVSDTKRTSAGWQGDILTGKRPTRVSVTVRSATDLETRCSCPDNRATGGFCAHAVAAGLAVLAVEKTPAAVNPGVYRIGANGSGESVPSPERGSLLGSLSHLPDYSGCSPAEPYPFRR